MQSLTANPVRLVAALAVVAVLGGGMFVLKSTRSGSSASSTTSQPRLLHTSAKHMHKPVTRTTAQHGGKTRIHVNARPVHRTAVAPSGLPWAVQDALAHHPVVVVAVVTSKAPVDQLTLAEAKAGAHSGKAGFVEVNAYSQHQIGPFDSMITVSANPAILVMRGPKAVTIQVPGYVDRQSVMQAIDDARILRAATAAS
ncbi:MAG: hypothetical protein ACJ77E_05440 [Gaiellaceae bacterium]